LIIIAIPWFRYIAYWTKTQPLMIGLRTIGNTLTRTPRNMTQACVENTLFLTLCGGQGMRVEGKDKPLLLWQGMAMVDHVLSSVPRDMRKLISANRNLTTYAQRGPLLLDADAQIDFEAQPGPLRGVLAGLLALSQDAEREWLLVAPGDTPKLPEDWWRHMMRQVRPGTDAVVACVTEQQHNLHILLRQGVLKSLTDYMRAGNYAVYLWLETLSLERAMFDDAGGFDNINYLHQLKS